MIFNIYLCCLAIGVIYSLVTTFIHGLVSAIDIGFDMDFSIETHVDLFLPIRPFTVMIFVSVFGGAGLILVRYMNDVLTLPIAFFAGYLAAKILYHTVYISLCKAQTTTKSVREAIGVEATVLEAIPHGGMGRISYVVNKNILSAVAMEADSPSNGFKKGAKVYIKDIVENVYYVCGEPLETRLAEKADIDTRYEGN